MPWTYSQYTGDLSFDGNYIATGYSGHGDGLDNPDDEFAKNVGPLPRGTYTVGDAFDHPRCGPWSMRLTPAASNDMDGRGGFLIHGDTAALNHTASDGCIILPLPIRMRIAGSADRTLIVTR